MFRVLYILLFASFLTACSEQSITPKSDATTLRSPAAGQAVGFESEHGAHVWRGLPFAESPTGDLRWRAPKPLAAWSGIKEALNYASACAQPVSQIGGTSSDGNVSGQEDCLYLDIYAPPMSGESAANATLPVMFWIHGGGNSIGTSSSYDGSILAEQENVIVVAVQYRLGPFGWFYQPGLSTPDDSEQDKSGNYGTLDLIQALRWTKDNIQAFGGNPDNITIFGESAGGFNVFSLLLSPIADGLFQRAISQSGSVQFANISAATEAHDNSSFNATQRMLEDAHLNDINQLRSLSAEQVLEAYSAQGGSGMISMPTILHDGHVLPIQGALQTLAAGHYNKVPTILGTNKDEQKLFQYMDSEYTDTWFGIWSRPRNRQVYQRDAGYKTDHWRLMGVEEPARSMTQSPVYAYRFDWDDLGTPLGMDFSFLFGAAHAFEIPFVFGGIGLGPLGKILDSTPHPEDRVTISKAMMRYWANFARNGNPNESASDLPTWHVWQEQEQFIVFDAARDSGIRMSESSTTPEALVARLLKDTSFENAGQRCDLYEQLLTRGTLLEKFKTRLGCD